MVFVYDGPGRPALKRGRRVQNSPPFWTAPSMDIVQAFGYYVHQAPGEAEAELAMLNQHGLLDAVITSDSDVFVFGATTVYRTIPAKTRRFEDEIAVYTAENISNVIGLTKKGLILVALLCGGDYDAVGLDGCGPATALGLAKCGYGESLIQIVQTFHGERLTAAIAQWRLDLQKELFSNSSGHLRGKERSLAKSIPDSFPSLDTLSLYLEPVVSAGASSHLAPVYDFRHREPSLNRLVMVSSTHLGWNTEEIIKDKFKRNVWEGVFLQMLYSKFILYDHTQQILATPNIQARLFNRKIANRAGRMAPNTSRYQARLLVSAQNFIALMNPSFQSSTNSDTFRAWVHIDALPERLLQELSGDTKTTQKADKSRVMFVEGSSGDSSQQAAAFPEPTKHHRGGILEALDHMMVDLEHIKLLQDINQ
uniref:XPG-I domain-containing protein n=1 Tax=Psilocybe cubensis TaxID=181762 RepID=A0A8H7XM35_PSICU